jgi:dihydroflavonol-4-reductase
MKTFVTSGTGLLGSNSVRLLVEQGHKVKILVRSKEKAFKIFRDIGVTIVEGDMRNIDSFASELDGYEILFHLTSHLFTK